MSISWRAVGWLALVGTALAVLLVITDLRATEDEHGNVINPGDGPATEVVLADFPDLDHPDEGRHDGPMYYAIAREPMHLDDVSDSLDRPAYRLQRPLYPWLAWALHPTGGGQGLLDALIVVGVLSLFLCGVAAGALAQTLGGGAWPALVVPILPGALLSLRISVSDSLAVGLALMAITLSFRSRPVAAVLVAVAAVLTKEPVFLMLLGVALWRRDRQGLALAAVPAAVAGLWALFLRVTVPAGTQDQVVEFAVPFRGLIDSIDYWLESGESTLSMLSVAAALALAIAVLVRDRLEHPLSWAILLNLGLILIVNRTVLGLLRNGTRTVLPLLALALIAVATPKAKTMFRLEPAESAEETATGSRR